MNATTKAGEERLRGRQIKMRTGNTKISKAGLRGTSAAASAKLRALFFMVGCSLGSAVHTVAAAPVDIGDIPYGTINEQALTLRIFYVIVPSTQLNEVATGSMIIPYWIKNGYSQPTPSHPSVAVPAYKNTLGASCDRTAKEQVTWSCLNHALGNAQTCTDSLRTSTQYWKLGSGHPVSSKQQRDLSAQIMKDINEKTYVRANPAHHKGTWAPPGKYTQTLEIVQPGHGETIWQLGGDPDYLAAYCLYDLYPGYAG